MGLLALLALATLAAAAQSTACACLNRYTQLADLVSCRYLAVRAECFLFLFSVIWLHLRFAITHWPPDASVVPLWSLIYLLIPNGLLSTDGCISMSWRTGMPSHPRKTDSFCHMMRKRIINLSICSVCAAVDNKAVSAPAQHSHRFLSRSDSAWKIWMWRTKQIEQFS